VLDLLKRNESEHLYWWANIVDGGRLKRWWYWRRPKQHAGEEGACARRRKGTKVITSGNQTRGAGNTASAPSARLHVQEDRDNTDAAGRKS